MQEIQKYLNTLLKNIKQFEKEQSTQNKIPSKLLIYWCREIKELVNETWLTYLNGRRADYKPTNLEIRQAFKKAGRTYLNYLIDDLMDKDCLVASISKKGQIVYGLTKKGKRLAAASHKAQNQEETTITPSNNNNNNKPSKPLNLIKKKNPTAKIIYTVVRVPKRKT